MKGIMIQGTASDVGKSLIVTAICRALAIDGIKVAPFKSQNMSNNSYVTVDDQEIGRAQGIQAEAAKIEATVWMNPILLKPMSDQHAEVVLLGKATKVLSGEGYRELFYETGLETIRNALDQLNKDYEVLVMEGAGSPVEVNLKDKELVNMKVAEMADVPVVLVADIDRGGVFASIIGTLELFMPEERKRVKGIIINKFRGDLSLFSDGIAWLEERTGIPVLGVLPYLDNHMIDGEDSLSLQAQKAKNSNAPIDIVVIKPPYLANFSDMDPFYYEPDVSIRWVSRIEEFGQPDAVILPGTKSTIRDLQFFKQTEMDKRLIQFVKSGGSLVGICGGFQMMGQLLVDKEGTDTGIRLHEEVGLGIIQATTVFLQEKRTVRTKGIFHPQTGIGRRGHVEGYEIHLGETAFNGDAAKEPFLLLENGREEGYYGNNGRIIGTYLHHIFHNDEWRNEWLNGLRGLKGIRLQETVHINALKDQKYNELADHLLKYVDGVKLREIIFNRRTNHEVD